MAKTVTKERMETYIKNLIEFLKGYSGTYDDEMYNILSNAIGMSHQDIEYFANIPTKLMNAECSANSDSDKLIKQFVKYLDTSFKTYPSSVINAMKIKEYSVVKFEDLKKLIDASNASFIDESAETEKSVDFSEGNLTKEIDFDGNEVWRDSHGHVAKFTENETGITYTYKRTDETIEITGSDGSKWVYDKDGALLVETINRYVVKYVYDADGNISRRIILGRIKKK